MAIQENGSGRFLTDSSASLMNPNVGREGMPFLSPESVQKPLRKRLLLNGQGQGAANLFDRLVADHDIVGAVCTTKEGDPLREKIVEHNTNNPDSPIPVIDLGKVNTQAAQGQMRELRPDLGVAFYLQKELKPETFSIPEYGTLNIHYSLLPERQGRTAMEWAIRDGDEKLGATVFLMSRKVDAGPIVAQMSYDNPGVKSQGRLYNEHLSEFVDLTLDAVNTMALAIDARRSATDKKPKLPVKAQIPEEMTYQEPITRNDLFVDFAQMDAVTIRNYMNAGGPRATALLEGKLYRIEKPTIIPGPTLQPGRIVEATQDTKIVETRSGTIHIGKAEEIT